MLGSDRRAWCPAIRSLAGNQGEGAYCREQHDTGLRQISSYLVIVGRGGGQRLDVLVGQFDLPADREEVAFVVEGHVRMIGA